VSAFQQPTVRNAQRTLTAIVVLLAGLLGGIAFVCSRYHIGAMDQNEPGYQSVLSQLVLAVAGRGWIYYLTIGSVLCVLCLSANTSFVDFPRVCRLIAADGYLPRWFETVSRRLVYSVGILSLAAIAGLLLVIFGGITDRLIPLFAVGAFLAFTISQAGMVVHWHRELQRTRQEAGPAGVNETKYYWRLAANGLGAATTGVALVVIVLAKFTEGAWLTIVVLGSLLFLFVLVHRHYERFERTIAAHTPLGFGTGGPPAVLIPFRSWDRPTAKALRFAMWLSPDVVAVHLNELEGEIAENESQHVRQQWHNEVEVPLDQLKVPPPELAIVRSPYRRWVEPILKQVNALANRFPERFVAVVVPEAIERHWWHQLLHRSRSRKLRKALRQNTNGRVVIVTVPSYVDD
jgi:hypothetical protein